MSFKIFASLGLILLVQAVPAPAAPELCGYFQPAVDFEIDPATGAVAAVAVAGRWPVLGDPNVEITDAPDADGTLRLDISGPVYGLTAIGHYSRTVSLPALPPGEYLLDVYLGFDYGTFVEERYCGALPLVIVAPIPTLGPLEMGLLALLVAMIGAWLLQRSTS